MTAPAAPKHLSLAARKWWREVTTEYNLDSHHVKLLTLACEAWDRGQQAREALEAAKSLTYLDRFGSPRLRPEAAIERDSRLSFARLLRELGLDVAEAAPRPPGLRANKGGR